jgi:hypothetical protein
MYTYHHQGLRSLFLGCGSHPTPIASIGSEDEIPRLRATLFRLFVLSDLAAFWSLVPTLAPAPTQPGPECQPRVGRPAGHAQAWGDRNARGPTRQKGARGTVTLANRYVRLSCPVQHTTSSALASVERRPRWRQTWAAGTSPRIVRTTRSLG